MAVGSRSTNTMTEGLRKLLADISDMKILPDADIPYLLNLEQQVVSKLREPIDRMQQQGITGVPAPGGMGGPVPPGPGAGMGAPGPMDQQIPGVSQQRMPSPDELRRVLSGAGGPA